MRKTSILTTFLIIIFTSCRGQNDLSTTSLVPKDSTAFYFPLKSFSDTSNNVRLDSFVTKWYSEQLYALREPIIYSDKSQNEIYRFTWLRTFHHPVSIRIERRNDDYVLFWKLASGAGGYEPGKLTIDEQKTLDKETWQEFISKLNQIDFWNLVAKQDNTGKDGSEWILEGKKEGKYHVVERWTPDKGTNYYECCNYLLGLTDLKIKGRDKY